MITTEKLRALIKDGDKYSDAEMQRISQIMHGLADAIFERWLRKKNNVD